MSEGARGRQWPPPDGEGTGGTQSPRLYGGQAVIEGVMIRGRRTVALACRRPDGGIYRYRERLRSPLLGSRLARAPFVRGVVVLWESISYGMRMLMRSAEVQMPAGQELGSGGNAGVLVVALAAAVVLFIGVPYLVTGLLQRLIVSAVALNVAEGLIRLALLLGYLAAISFLPDIRRVFAYHGAEHMTIHAFEHGDPLTPERIAPYPTAHARCGTAFLLVVVVVAIVVFAFVPRVNVIVDIAIRLVLVVPVAAISYEVLKLGAAHERIPAMRLLVAPGLVLQRLTTRRPDERMIEVAVASLAEALAARAPRPARREERHRGAPRGRRRRGGRALRARPLPHVLALRGAASLEVRDPLAEQLGEGRLQRGHLPRERQGRVLEAEVRVRRAPRAARPVDRGAGADPHVDRDRGGAARGRGGRSRDPRRGPEDRRVSRGRPRWAGREHDGLRGPHHAPADGRGRHLPGRTESAEEQGESDDGASRAPPRADA